MSSKSKWEMIKSLIYDCLLLGTKDSPVCRWNSAIFSSNSKYILKTAIKYLLEERREFEITV